MFRREIKKEEGRLHPIMDLRRNIELSFMTEAVRKDEEKMGRRKGKEREREKVLFCTRRINRSTMDKGGDGMRGILCRT